MTSPGSQPHLDVSPSADPRAGPLLEPGWAAVGAPTQPPGRMQEVEGSRCRGVWPMALAGHRHYGPDTHLSPWPTGTAADCRPPRLGAGPGRGWEKWRVLTGLRPRGLLLPLPAQLPPSKAASGSVSAPFRVSVCLFPRPVPTLVLSSECVISEVSLKPRQSQNPTGRPGQAPCANRKHRGDSPTVQGVGMDSPPQAPALGPSLPAAPTRPHPGPFRVQGDSGLVWLGSSCPGDRAGASGTTVASSLLSGPARPMG